MSSENFHALNAAHEAARKGDLDELKKIIKKRPEVIDQPHTLHKTTPICFALQHGHIKIVEFLLEKQKNKDSIRVQLMLLEWAYCEREKNNKEEIVALLQSKIFNAVIKPELSKEELTFEERMEAYFLKKLEEKSVSVNGTTLDKNKKISYDKLYDFITDYCAYKNFFLLHGVPQGENEPTFFTQAIKNLESVKSCLVTDADKRAFSDCYSPLIGLFSKQKDVEKLKSSSEALIELLNGISEQSDDDKRELASCYASLGSVFLNQKDLDEAKKQYLIAIKTIGGISNQYDCDKRNLASYHGSLGEVFFKQKKDFEKVKELFVIAIKTIEGIGKQYDNDKCNLASYRSYLGLTFYNQKNFKEAEKQHLIAIKTIKTIKDISKQSDNNKRDLSSYHGYLGQAFRKQKNLEKAEEHYLIGITIIENINKQSDNNKRNLAPHHFHLGVLFFEQNDLKKAEERCVKAIEITKGISKQSDKNKFELVRYYTLLGAIFVKQDDFKTAIEYFFNAIEASSKLSCDVYNNFPSHKQEFLLGCFFNVAKRGRKTIDSVEFLKNDFRKTFRMKVKQAIWSSNRITFKEACDFMKRWFKECSFDSELPMLVDYIYEWVKENETKIMPHSDETTSAGEVNTKSFSENKAACLGLIREFFMHFLSKAMNPNSCLYLKKDNFALGLALINNPIIFSQELTISFNKEEELKCAEKIGFFKKENKLNHNDLRRNFKLAGLFFYFIMFSRVNSEGVERATKLSDVIQKILEESQRKNNLVQLVSQFIDPYKSKLEKKVGSDNQESEKNIKKGDNKNRVQRKITEFFKNTTDRKDSKKRKLNRKSDSPVGPPNKKMKGG